MKLVSWFRNLWRKCGPLSKVVLLYDIVGLLPTIMLFTMIALLHLGLVWIVVAGVVMFGSIGLLCYTPFFLRVIPFFARIFGLKVTVDGKYFVVDE